MPMPRPMLHAPVKASARMAARKRPRASIDQWFDRAGQASQVLLLLLGVFGYFYTVLPLYQKALLAEEIAKTSPDLNNATDELARATVILKSKEGVNRPGAVHRVQTPALTQWLIHDLRLGAQVSHNLEKGVV